MQPANISSVHISYKCPDCDSKIEKEVMYIPHKRGRKHPRTITAFWCTRCGSRNKLEYRVFKRRDGTKRIKVYESTIEGVEFVRRFKVLA